MLAALALVAVACPATGEGSADGERELASRDESAGAAPDETPAYGGKLVVAVPMESNGWNPYMNQWGDSPTLVGTSMIEPLAVNAPDGTPQPWLAQSWEPNGDFTEWEITLRPGVLFHDGTPLNAAAAKKSLDKLYASGLYSVQYGPLYERVEVTGEMTFRVYLKVKWAQYPTSLPFAWMLAPAMLDRPDEGMTSPVGTGPFRFVRWTQFESLTASRFERYWRKDAKGRNLPYIDEIEFRLIDDPIVRSRALKNGDIDVAMSAGSDIADRLEGEGQFDVIKDYMTQRTLIVLNTAEGQENKGNPFTNVHARRALAYAIDRERISRAVGPTVESTTHPYRPDSRWAPTGDDGYVDYDPDMARSEIEIYKKETGAKKLSFQLNAPVSGDATAAISELKANLAEVGIELELVTEEPLKISVLTALGDFEASMVRTHDFPDPDVAIFFYSSKTRAGVGELSLNVSRYTSSRLDANLKTLREITDYNQRKVANDDLIRETNNAAIHIWLYNTPSSMVANPKVRGLDGFRTNPFTNSQPKPWIGEAWLP